MGRKRKIAHGEFPPGSNAPAKRMKNQPPSIKNQYPVLRLHYESVTTLREWITTRFPNSSTSRKQRLKAVPLWAESLLQTKPEQCPQPTSATIPTHSASSSETIVQAELSRLLDTTIIGHQGQKAAVGQRFSTNIPQTQNILQLSQKLRTTYSSASSQLGVPQSEIVDFAVGHLFNSVHRAARFPPHVLCNGFSRSPAVQGESDLWSNGLYCVFRNCNAATLQTGAWPALLKLLGKDGDQVMLDLLFHCAIFIPLMTGKNNLCQISGIQLSELPILKDDACVKGMLKDSGALPVKSNKGVSINRPSEIKIVRNRMFYARPGLNAKGLVKFGLQHIHVFNRYPDASNPQQVVHVLKHIFPRQFGLHNSFTCKPDRRETLQTQKDYTMREQEIALSLRRKARHVVQGVPKRLRGVAKLVGTVLKRHSRCAYVELLRYHCAVEWIDHPEPATDDNSNAAILQVSALQPPQGVDIVELATPPEQVLRFCQSVLLRLLPPDLFDANGEKSWNMHQLFKCLDDFIHFRKRETTDLHSMMQGFKISTIPWLKAPNTQSGSKLSLSDSTKRTELLAELIYYIFDSILIPLIRSNFHVTESNTHTHQLFYFRHDVWRRLTEPCLSNLRESMFEVQISNKQSKKQQQIIPHGHMRLVPKGATFRPIMNLKRRPMVYQNDQMVLGPRSVNMILKPVYSMLKHEKLRRPNLLGASIFSVDEIYPRLKQFRAKLHAQGLSKKPLYFAKVDVTNCFDTIPQAAVLDMIERVCDQSGYCSSRHAEISARHASVASEIPLTKRFRDREPARATDDRKAFHQYIGEQYGERRNNTVFVEQGVPMLLDREKLMKLLKDHVSGNTVKIGKKFLTQKRGIPQGSILSSILCNFFYGQFETECLEFLNRNDTLLLRLLDDFLLITLDKDTASRFLDVMHQGNTQYGISIKPQKSLSNFPFSVDGLRIAQNNGRAFPYCGKLINTTNLEISRDRDRQILHRINESLSVERSKASGEAFYRLTLDAMKRQIHAQYTDATLNSSETVLQTLYRDFLWSALRMHAYIQDLGPSRRPTSALIIRTIKDLGSMTFSMITSSSKLKDDMNYECRVSSFEIQWLISRAFKQVFQSKQSLYGAVVHWLDAQTESSKSKSTKKIRRLYAAVAASSANVDWCTT